jgi:hypothetical protein
VRTCLFCGPLTILALSLIKKIPVPGLAIEFRKEVYLNDRELLIASSSTRL